VLLSAATFAREESHPALRDAAATRIEVDEEASPIRFFIDGQERAVLNADGLHVKGNIEFPGRIIDTEGGAAPAKGAR
jgi:hypothetical protein